ncbi:MAG: transposase [Verrucomicrobiales bacterium]|nr:transposase [Verrucomicrobiales bacterium]
MPARPFLFSESQAGCFHVVNRIYDRRYLLDREGKDLLLKLVRAYEDVCGVEVLTFCIMDNHFHLLVRVPHRPEGFDVPLEVVVARLDRALGVESAALMHRNLEFWRSTKNESAIEEWRRRQVERMFSLSEFMKAVQLRFSRWYNRKAGRKGTLWEGRYTSVIVEEEERALRTMAAYIDLNPVRAGMVADPADYCWSGYSEAMAGKARSRRGLVRIVGQMAWPRATAAEARPWGTAAFPASVERRALVFYRAILGGQGAERKREDGTVVRRGLSEKVREKLTTPNERRLAAEVLTRRVRHFTRGVVFGGRAMIDQWFESNRQVVQGRSRTERKRGAKSLGRPALRGLYALRDVK